VSPWIGAQRWRQGHQFRVWVGRRLRDRTKGLAVIREWCVVKKLKKISYKLLSS
jgi:hypothetical protein